MDIKKAILTMRFLLVAFVMHEVLGILKPADKLLQSRTSFIATGFESRSWRWLCAKWKRCEHESSWTMKTFFSCQQWRKNDRNGSGGTSSKLSSSTTRISHVLRYNGWCNCSGQAMPVHFRILPSVGSLLKEQFRVLLVLTAVSSYPSQPEISVFKYADDTALCFPMYKQHSDYSILTIQVILLKTELLSGQKTSVIQ